MTTISTRSPLTSTFNSPPPCAFYLDLGAVPETSPVQAWMGEPRPLRDVPASFLPADEDTYYVDTVLLDDYDAVVFVGETQASRRR